MFPSLKGRGRVPLSASIFVADHLRPAAKKAGVPIEDAQRFGLHNLRHSLSNWLVNKAKVETRKPKCVLASTSPVCRHDLSGLWEKCELKLFEVRLRVVALTSARG